jgi:hypothetical protein
MRDVYRAPERSVGPTHGEPSTTDAVERVIDAGQRLVSERLELAKLEVQEAVTEKVSQGAVVAIASAFAFGGWWIAVAGLVAYLNDFLVLPASLAVVGGAHLLLGGTLAATALKRGRRAATQASARHGAQHENGRNGAPAAAGARP